MPYCHFSEDEYEDNLLIELRDRFGQMLPHFKPSRTLEKSLGYDFAVSTGYERMSSNGLWLDDDILRALLPIQRRAILPHRFVTTFVQCKVPFFVSRRLVGNAAQYDRFGVPFFRVAIPAEQNQSLLHLENALGDRGVVRYAAPCFHTAEESEIYCIEGEVTQRSHFITPAALAGHDEYVYLQPNAVGWGFSKPTPIPATPLLRTLFALVSQAAPEPLAAHVSGLWRSLQIASEESGFQYDRESLVRVASRVAGDRAHLPLDPLGILPREMSGWPDGSAEPSIFSFALAIATIERLAKDFAECDARIFYRP